MAFVLKLPSQLKKGAAELEHEVKKKNGEVFDFVDPNAHLAWNRNKGGPVWGVKNPGPGNESPAPPEAKPVQQAKPKGWNVQPQTGTAFSIAESLAKVDNPPPQHPHVPPNAPLAGRFSGVSVAPLPSQHQVTPAAYKEPVFEGAAWADEVEDEEADLPVLDVPIPPGPAALQIAAAPKAKEPEPRSRVDAWGARGSSFGGEDTRGSGQQFPPRDTLSGLERRRSDDFLDRRFDDRGFERSGYGDRRPFGYGANQDLVGGRYSNDLNQGFSDHRDSYMDRDYDRYDRMRNGHRYEERGMGNGMSWIPDSRGCGDRGYADRGYADRGNGNDRDNRGFGNFRDNRGYGNDRDNRGYANDRDRPRFDDRSNDGYMRGRSALGGQSPAAGPVDKGVGLLARPAAYANPSNHLTPAVGLDEPQRIRSTSLHDRPKDLPRFDRPEDCTPASPGQLPSPMSSSYGRPGPAEDVSGWAALGKERTKAAQEPAKPVMIMKRPDAPPTPTSDDKKRPAADASARHRSDPAPAANNNHHAPERASPPVHAHSNYQLQHTFHHAAPQGSAAPEMDEKRLEEKRRFKEEAIARLKAQAERAAAKPVPLPVGAASKDSSYNNGWSNQEANKPAVQQPAQQTMPSAPQIMRRAQQPEQHAAVHTSGPQQAPVVDSAVNTAGKGNMNRRAKEGEGQPEDKSSASVPKASASGSKAEVEAGAGEAAQGKQGKKAKQPKEPKQNSKAPHDGKATQTAAPQTPRDGKTAPQAPRDGKTASHTPRDGKAPRGSKQQVQKPADVAEPVAAAAPVAAAVSVKSEPAAAAASQQPLAVSKPAQEEGSSGKQEVKQEGKHEGNNTKTPRSKPYKAPKPSKENSDASAAPNNANATPPEQAPTQGREDTNKSSQEGKVLKGNNTPRNIKREEKESYKAPRRSNGNDGAASPHTATTASALPKVNDTLPLTSAEPAKVEDCSRASKADKLSKAPAMQIYRPPVRNNKAEAGGNQASTSSSRQNNQAEGTWSSTEHDNKVEGNNQAEAEGSSKVDDRASSSGRGRGGRGRGAAGRRGGHRFGAPGGEGVKGADAAPEMAAAAQ